MARGNTPEAFIPYLVDDVALCGAWIVWLASQRRDLQWLTGRLVSATWDADELVGKRSEIEVANVRRSLLMRERRSAVDLERMIRFVKLVKDCQGFVSSSPNSKSCIDTPLGGLDEVGEQVIHRVSKTPATSLSEEDHVCRLVMMLKRIRRSGLIRVQGQCC